jgi:hypothetical protein
MAVARGERGWESRSRWRVEVSRENATSSAAFRASHPPKPCVLLKPIAPHAHFTRPLPAASIREPKFLLALTLSGKGGIASVISPQPRGEGHHENARFMSPPGMAFAMLLLTNVAVETDVAVSRLTPVCREAEHHRRRGVQFPAETRVSETWRPGCIGVVTSPTTIGLGTNRRRLCDRL